MTRVTPSSVSILVALTSVVAVAGTGGCRDDGVEVIPGDVVGRVCDPVSGQGIPSAALVLDMQGRLSDTLSSADGSFRFDRIQPGTGVLRVPDAATGVDRLFDVEVIGKENTVLTDTACRGEPVVPGAGGVDGQVCNRHTGSLVTDADVIVATTTEVFRTTTDGEGRFLLSPLPDGEHVLTVQGEGFQRSFAVEVAQGSITHLDLGEHCIETDLSQGTLSGSLCDPTDPTGALVGASVTATDALGTVVSDVTDTNGEFFLNALAPGPATVSIIRGTDVNAIYGVDVVAGSDAVVVRELSCREGDSTCSYEVVGSPTVDQRPVDIIFVIDDSGSMNDDNDAVQNNINTFSSSIAAAGVDYRVVLVGTTNVPAPLGGSAQFLKVNTSVDSNDPLIELVDHYGDYSGFLREEAVKHFVVITDDESDMPANQFTNQVSAWPGFASWTLHSIVAFGSDPQDGCSTGAAYGHQYVNLSAQTGGVTSPICDANYAEVFDAVVAAVTTVTLPCTLTLAAPAGVTTDPARLEVTYEGTTLPVRGTCNGPGWRYDPATSSVVACPETCAALAEDDGSGVIVADVGCFED